MTDPDPITQTAAPTTLRSDVGAAVERAWDRAVAAGALPAWPDDAVRPPIEVERPGRPGARRLREQPRDEARPAVSDGAARDRRGAGRRAGRRGRRPIPRRTPIAAAEVAPPGLPQPAPARRRPRGDDRGDPRRPAAWGRVAGRSGRARSTSSSCRPTRPGRCTSATPAARSSATCSAASSRPAASGSRASTTSTTRAARSGNLGASVAAIRRGEPVPEDGYHGDYVDDLAAALPDDVWAAADRARTPTPTAMLGHWAAGRVREGHRGEPRRARRPLRRLDERGSLHDEGWVERAVERLRERGHVYEQDGATVVPLDRLRRRQGPGDLSGRTASRPTSPPTSAT